MEGGVEMTIFISALIKGEENMEELASWIDEQKLPDLGVELIAFTHDQEYWDRLCALLNRLKCPISFHGPYIGVEATVKPGTKEHDWLMESYDRVFSLAKEYNVKHVVFHYTQNGFSKDNLIESQEISKQNIDMLMELAKKYNVNMLIENLAHPEGKLSLYNNEEYNKIFLSNPAAISIIDVGHAHINKMDIEGFLIKHSDRVKAYHFHNNNGIDDQHNSILDGSIDYSKILGLFKKYTPDADIILEYEPHTGLSNEDLLGQYKYILENIK